MLFSIHIVVDFYPDFNEEVHGQSSSIEKINSSTFVDNNENNRNSNSNKNNNIENSLNYEIRNKSNILDDSNGPSLSTSTTMSSTTLSLITSPSTLARSSQPMISTTKAPLLSYSLISPIKPTFVQHDIDVDHRQNVATSASWNEMGNKNENNQDTSTASMTIDNSDWSNKILNNSIRYRSDDNSTRPDQPVKPVIVFAIATGEFFFVI